MSFDDLFRRDRSSDLHALLRRDVRQARDKLSYAQLRLPPGGGGVHPSRLPRPLPGGAFSSYLQLTLLSCAAAICHLPSRFNQILVQTWHCFASGCVLSLPMACSLP